MNQLLKKVLLIKFIFKGIFLRIFFYFLSFRKHEHFISLEKTKPGKFSGRCRIFWYFTTKRLAMSREKFQNLQTIEVNFAAWKI